MLLSTDNSNTCNMLMTNPYNVSNSVEKWGQKEKTSFQIVEGYSFIPVNRYTCISSIF